MTGRRETPRKHETPRTRLAHGARGRRRHRPAARAAVKLAAAAALTVANVAASSTGPANGQASGSAFDGTRAVGALFYRHNGRLGRHFCTASVVHSPAGNLLLTAAHCMIGLTLKPAGGVVFAPGYHRGRIPLGLWVVTSKFVTAKWASSRDPNEDFAFLVVSDRQEPIERATGAERLSTSTRLPHAAEVIGYPVATQEPIRCSAMARAFVTRTLRQMKFVCGGFTGGTSGGPFLLHVSARTGTGWIFGVIGGYQEGGDTADISYSPMFRISIAALYRTATAPSPSPSPTPTPTPSSSPTPTPSA